MISPQVEKPHVVEVSDLYGEVRDLVAGDIELHEARHGPDLLGQGDQPVVVDHEALQLGKLAHRGRQVRQLVPANVEVLEGLEVRESVWNGFDGVVVENKLLQARVVRALVRHLHQLVPRQVCQDGVSKVVLISMIGELSEVFAIQL